jgi:hypothetical protein
MQASPLHYTPPASGGVSYYPAQYRATYPNVRSALAAIGCTGEAAALYLANAAAEASPAVVVPVKFAPHPGDEFVAVVVRKPGGKAALWLGLLGLADEDRTLAEDAAQQFAEVSGSKGWAIFEWTRQARVAQ